MLYMLVCINKLFACRSQKKGTGSPEAAVVSCLMWVVAMGTELCKVL